MDVATKQRYIDVVRTFMYNVEISFESERLIITLGLRQMDVTKMHRYIDVVRTFVYNVESWFEFERSLVTLGQRQWTLQQSNVILTLYERLCITLKFRLNPNVWL